MGTGIASLCKERVGLEGLVSHPCVSLSRQDVLPDQGFNAPVRPGIPGLRWRGPGVCVCFRVLIMYHRTSMAIHGEREEEMQCVRHLKVIATCI